MKSGEEQIILKVQNISKVYNLQQKFQANLKDVFSSRRKKDTAEYQALDNISFELKRGESLGIFGANGAGKSTLLRILSGITKPSSGEIDIYGRCLSVLDIGTGFHPELTGRENIFMSGEILGMGRQAVREKLDDIINFSELEGYIDEPVKNYSSGMYLRLAFSVIAFLEGDLMLFDETMSVGDLSFRMKCRAKIEEMIKSGKSMIVVSHNMNEIISLCSTFMHLDGGKIKAVSNSYDIVARYINKSINPDKEQADKQGQKPEPELNKLVVTDFSNFNVPDGMDLLKLQLLPVGENESATQPVYRNQDLELKIEYIKKEAGSTIDAAFSMTDAAGNIVLSSSPLSSNKFFEYTGTSKCIATCIIPKDLFNAGQLFINVYFVKNKSSMLLSLAKIISFRVEIEQTYAGVKSDLMNVPGALAPSFNWTLETIKSDGGHE